MKRAKHINQTEKEFESRKRQQLKCLERAFWGEDGVMRASAFLPPEVYRLLAAASYSVKKAQDLYRQKTAHVKRSTREET